MFKSITTRAIVPVTLAVTGFVIVCLILLYSVMKTDLTNDAVIYETNLADTIVKSTRYAMLKADREMLRNIIDNIGAQPGVEHVRIFNKKGIIMFSKDHSEIDRLVDKKTAGCIECHAGPVASSSIGVMQKARRFVNEHGTAVVAITAPVYNEPACYTADCHFHSAGQKVLGTLDIGLSTAPLTKTLSVLRGRMIGFSIMVLLLTIGGVSALLRRNVFIPLREIKEFTAEVSRGNLSAELSRIPGELNDLATNVRNLALKLRRVEQETESLKGNQKKIEEKAAMKAENP